MFDTRSGFWLMASIVIIGVLATVGTVLFAPDEELTHYTFAAAIGFPMTIVLPIIAILSITGEWSQRTGLTTFTLVPHREPGPAGQDRLVGDRGCRRDAGRARRGRRRQRRRHRRSPGPTWCGTSRSPQFGTIVVGSLLCLLTGTMLGMVIRSSPGALVTYFVMTLVLPTVFGILATSQPDFVDIQPWVDAELARSFLFEGTADG